MLYIYRQKTRFQISHARLAAVTYSAAARGGRRAGTELFLVPPFHRLAKSTCSTFFFPTSSSIFALSLLFVFSFLSLLSLTFPPCFYPSPPLFKFLTLSVVLNQFHSSFLAHVECFIYSLAKTLDTDTIYSLLHSLELFSICSLQSSIPHAVSLVHTTKKLLKYRFS